MGQYLGLSPDHHNLTRIADATEKILAILESAPQLPKVFTFEGRQVVFIPGESTNDLHDAVPDGRPIRSTGSSLEVEKHATPTPAEQRHD